MDNNNNFSVLPFYTSIDMQNARKSYAYGNVYPLFCPLNRLPPFQILTPKEHGEIWAVRLITEKGEFVKDILADMKNTGYQFITNLSNEYNVAIYPAYLPMAINAKVGQYYLEIENGEGSLFSDIFTMVGDVSGYLKVEWWDIDNAFFDAGMIVYKANGLNFKNVLYLCTELGKPEYVFEEEGEKRDGYFFPEKQVSEKTYKFSFLASEYLCDVMRFIRMSDYVTITDKYGRVYKCDTFLITPKWQTQGDIASVEAEFETDTVVKKIGRGYIRNTTNGDFDNSFNKDFNNGVNS